MFTLIESVRVAWQGITTSKLRTFLTMLGVIIGVAAVITLVSVGQGAQATAAKQIQSLGTNLITVTSRGTAYRFDPRDLPNLQDRVQGILYLLPELTSAAQTIRSESKTYTATIQGTGFAYPEVRERDLTSGTWFTEEDVATRRRVAVLGVTTIKNLYDADVDPLGSTIRFRGQSFEVIGVAEPRGSLFNQDQDDIVYVPYSTLARSLGLTRFTSLVIKVHSSDHSHIVAQEVTDYYVSKFRAPDPVRVQSQDQLLSTVGSVTQIFTLLLGAIASISLAVGGIGIMNIMLVSVSERTREIGIRKAIGAKKRDVLLQFLIEAILLSVTGGAIGIAIGIIGAAGVSRALSFETLVTSSSVLISFGFSLAVGILFGFYPAYRASTLDPIEALRRE